MPLFIASVTVVLVVSGLCSLTEAAIYSVRMPYIRRLVDGGSAAGVVLTKFKRNMERPITAILILNTAANTAGASVAGAQARHLFGDASLLWFSAIFTLSVLFFSEIIPKIAGVAYNRVVARLVSIPLEMVIASLTPVVWLSQRLTSLIEHGPRQPTFPETDVKQMAALSAEEGSILPYEAELVDNVLQLNDVRARDIMTPRTVVFSARADTHVRDIAAEVERLPHSRIPIYTAHDQEDWTGVAFRADILARLARDDFDVTLGELQRPIGFVPDVMPGHQLLNEFIKRRAHLFGVIDEYGAVVGVVSLEDVMESLIGAEIVDETDAVVDLQREARERGARRMRDAGAPPRDDDPPASGP